MPHYLQFANKNGPLRENTGKPLKQDRAMKAVLELRKQV